MAQPPQKQPWWKRFKDKNRLAREAREHDYATDYYRSFRNDGAEVGRQYLLGNLRTNPPGYDTQDMLQMSMAYTGMTYLAVNVFVTQAGQAEVKLFEHDPDEPDKRELLSHYEDASQLIHYPNPDDTFGNILQQIALQRRLTGTAAVWIPHDVEDKTDRPTEMYVLSTASLLPQPIGPEYPNGAYLVQPWYPAGPFATLPQSRGLGAIVPAEQIIRIKEPHPFFRWIGYATLTAISTQMDAARMIDLTRMNHMQRGFDPAAVISFDPSVNRPDNDQLRRLEAQIQNVWQGPQNAGRIVVAPAGADVNTFGNTPVDMAYEQGWTQLRDFALSCHHVNAGVAGMVDGLNYATLFASLRWFYIFGLGPFLDDVAQSFTRHLLQSFFDKSFLMDLKGRSITDEDIIEKQVNTLGKLKAIKVGEVRRLYSKIGFPVDLPPTDRDDEWAGEGDDKEQGNPLAALAGGRQGLPGSSLQEHQGADENAMQRKRPNNPQGQGTAGPRGPQPGYNGHGQPRKMLTLSEREDQIGAALEKHLSNGKIKQFKG